MNTSSARRRVARIASLALLTAVAGMAAAAGPAAAATGSPPPAVDAQSLPAQPPDDDSGGLDDDGPRGTAEPAGPPSSGRSNEPDGPRGSGTPNEPGEPGRWRDSAEPPPPAPEDPEAAAARQAARERALAAERAARQARAAREAAERARELARERAEQAATAENARLSWDSRGRPHRMITVRPDRVELVIDGRLTRMQGRVGGPLTLAALARYVPGDWLSVQGGQALLNATLVLGRGTVLQIDGLSTLRLTGGATPSDASSIYSGGGRILLRGLIVSSVDPRTQQPVPPNAAGRPFIEVNSRGYLEAVDATLADLGSPPVGKDDGTAALRFNPDSTGSVVRTAVQRATTGLALSRSRDVRLEAVTVSESADDGLVLRGDRGTTLTGVRAERNQGNGVEVTGESTDRPITGVSTSGNGLFGLALIGQEGTRVVGVNTMSDRAGGIRLGRSVNVLVSDFTATDQPIGLFTHVNSTGIVIDKLRATGGRRAIVVEKSTEGVEVRGASIQGARVTGVAAGGKAIRLVDLQVMDSKAGVRIERGARDVQIAGLRLSGGQDGVVAASGTSGVVLDNVAAEHVGADAVRTASAGMRIVGGRISGGSTAIDVAANTTISGTTINASEEGIHSRSPETVRLEDVTIDTTSIGVNTASGAPVVILGSRVHALEAVRGPITYEGVNDVSLPPLNLLSAIGLPLVVLAVVLEVGHVLYHRRNGVNTRRVPPPPPATAPPPPATASATAPVPASATAS